MQETEKSELEYLSKEILSSKATLTSFPQLGSKVFRFIWPHQKGSWSAGREIWKVPKALGVKEAVGTHRKEGRMVPLKTGLLASNRKRTKWWPEVVGQVRN